MPLDRYAPTAAPSMRRANRRLQQVMFAAHLETMPSPRSEPTSRTVRCLRTRSPARVYKRPTTSPTNAATPTILVDFARIAQPAHRMQQTRVAYSRIPPADAMEFHYRLWLQPPCSPSRSQRQPQAPRLQGQATAVVLHRTTMASAKAPSQAL